MPVTEIPKEGLRAFLDYRAGLARRIQAEWIDALDGMRRTKPHLDLVLTHVDDRFDAGMRDALGADAAAVLPLLEEHEFTFLVEDPATVWNLGPQRYPEIARRYRPLTRRPGKLGIDINVVERYQDVYPTKKQTGTELFQLLNLASRSFPRVMLYFESSVLAPDLPLLAAATGAAVRVQPAGAGLAVESLYGGGVAWKGPARVDGRLWPATNGERLWLPAGAHSVEPASAEPPVRILDFNGDLRTAAVRPDAIEIAYQSFSRAIARLDRAPSGLEVDGVETPVNGGTILLLPRGQHVATIQY